MPRKLDEKIALVALIAFAAWLFVGLPLLYLSSHMIDWGTVPQWITAGIAGGALGAAIISITSQRETARKRAAIDFFLKTDLDHNMLQAHADFETALKKLKKHMADSGSVRSFAEGTETGNDDYKKIIRYLNVHELVAVGIKNKVFDDQVCYNFWSDAMVRHVSEAGSIIQYEIAEGGSEALFLELRTLSTRWSARIRDWNSKFKKV
jgi:hypothetical protein